MKLYYTVDPVYVLEIILKLVLFLYKQVSNTRLVTKPKEWLSNIKKKFGRTETTFEGNDVDIEDVSFILKVLLIKYNLLRLLRMF